MGYEIHITRQDNWFDEGIERQISIEEWRLYIANDPEMRLDNYAEAGLPDGGILRVESEGLAVWTNHSNLCNVWFSYYKGNICVKGPDAEIILKMVSISKVLNARVQGDDLEYYDEKGLISINSANETKPKSRSSLLKMIFSFWNKE